ncbi:MAG TPA: 5'/3'-nucleotidase SurE [Saprospiraceae bacterium]|nr:5'/3'-nucleotidase SurE [Saprospirales bacterium]HRQ31056.1 5'/3'-nucleotidase SurE [Saprospiraceae bacterium]
MKEKPLILVTNDDGIVAPGIRALVEIAAKFGEVVVIAPDSPQSGQGHAVTIMDPIRLNKVSVFPGIESWECTGTPVDCVKLATNVVLKGRKIDFCLSGINHGSNASINILYSGTMSAAMEASLEGIMSLGISLLDYSQNADFSASKIVLEKILQKLMVSNGSKPYLLNVNIPNVPIDQIRGIKTCRQAQGNWEEEFMEAKDPRNQTYYWLTGKFVNYDKEEDTDLWALENNFVSIVPSHHDLTNYSALSSLSYFNEVDVYG